MPRRENTIVIFARKINNEYTREFFIIIIICIDGIRKQ